MVNGAATCTLANLVLWFIPKVVRWWRSCFRTGRYWRAKKTYTMYRKGIQLTRQNGVWVVTPESLPSWRLSLLSILLRLYLTAVLKLTSFMSWRSRRNGIGDGRQSVSSAHCEPLSYISSICLFVSFSKGCHRSLVASPHSQIALIKE